MYKKCDIMKMSNIPSEIIQKEIQRIAKNVDAKLESELNKHKIKTRKPQYVKAWLTRKRLVVHMTVDGLNTKVEIVSKDKPLCKGGEVIKGDFSARSLVGMSDCVLKVDEKVYQGLEVSDMLYIDQSAEIRRIEIVIVKE